MLIIKFIHNLERMVLLILFKKIEYWKPKFVEIGVGDYTESNTRFLFESRTAKGLIIDCLEDLSIRFQKI